LVLVALHSCTAKATMSSSCTKAGRASPCPSLRRTASTCIFSVPTRWTQLACAGVTCRRQRGIHAMDACNDRRWRWGIRPSGKQQARKHPVRLPQPSRRAGVRRRRPVVGGVAGASTCRQGRRCMRETASATCHACSSRHPAWRVRRCAATRLAWSCCRWRCIGDNKADMGAFFAVAST
jgi:hypothetical protein